MPTAQATPAPRASKTCMVRIVVRDCENMDAPPIHDKTGDHNERYFRDWIVNTMWWAARNNKQITMYPEEVL